MTKWDECLKKLIMLFREKYQDLLPEERAKISNLDDLSPPCQIEVFWVTNTRFKLSFQMLLVSHLKDIEDLNFAVHGPFELYDAPDELESAIMQDKWNRALPEEDAQRFAKTTASYREMVEDALVEFSGQIRAYISSLIFQKPMQLPPVCNRRWLTSEAFYWFIVGDMRLVNVEEIIARILEAAKKQAQTNTRIVAGKPQENHGDTRKVIKGYGTFLYPPVRFDELPDLTFRARIMGLPALAMPRLAVNTMYNNRKVLVYQDGFLFIGESNIHKASAMLNELTAVISFLLTPSFSLKESELGETVIDSNDFKLVRGSMPVISERTRLFEDRWSRFDKHKWARRKQLSSDELLPVLERAKQIAEQKSVVDNLVLWHEGFTYFENSEYTQSFIINWIIIEKHIFALLSEFLQHQLVDKGRVKKLLKSSSWTTDHFLEVLSLSGRIQKDDYREYMRLKRKRNRIVHEGERVTQEDAEACLKRCRTIIEKEL